LEPSDWTLLRDLRLAALADAPYAFASTYEREQHQTDDHWRARVEADVWFVAQVGGVPAGLAAGRAAAGRVGLLSMWVHPQHRGHRLAEHLIAAVRGWGVTQGAGELTLWVADGNAAAMRAYERAGFVPTGHRQPLPSDPAVGEEQWALPLGHPTAPAGPHRSDDRMRR
jgi:GNAT superfamily N-acetyltransferase